MSFKLFPSPIRPASSFSPLNYVMYSSACAWLKCNQPPGHSSSLARSILWHKQLLWTLLLLLLLSRFSRVWLCATLTLCRHGLQPTRLLHPWNSPDKNTGVGCHFLLQCMKVKSESEVTQSCLTLSNPMDCSLPGSSIHGIFQATVLEWGAIAFSLVNLTTLQIPLSLVAVKSLCAIGTWTKWHVQFQVPFLQVYFLGTSKLLNMTLKC